MSVVERVRRRLGSITLEGRLHYVVWASYALKVIALLWISRSWFFTDDDWDYITRTSWTDLVDPHAGHLNWFASVWAYVVRGIVGLDYWPGYALFAAIAWPLVGIAAWYVWRALKVDPRWAAFGAVLLTWLGSAAWIQFGHAGQGIAAAALIVAIYLDTKPLTTRWALLNSGVSLVAAFASSTAGLAVIFRAGLGVLYRRWNAVVGAGVAALAYVSARLAFTLGGPGTFRAGLKEAVDVITPIRAGLEVLGVGLRSLVPWVPGHSWVLGLLLVVVAGLALWKLRFSYFSMALVGSAAVYVAMSVITRFLGRSHKLHVLLAGEWSGITAPRFTNLAVVYLLVAVVPLLASKKLRTKWIPPAAAAVMAVMLFFGTLQGFVTWRDIADKSADPKASWPAALVEMRADGEPAYPTRTAWLHPLLSKFFDVRAIDYVINAGLTDSLLASDIYRVADVPDKAESKTRGYLRMNIQANRPRTQGDWSGLGVESAEQCRLVEGEQQFEVLDSVRFRLDQVEGNNVTLEWKDRYGKGVQSVASDLWVTRDGSVWVEIPGPEDGVADTPTITVQSTAVEMCLDPSPAA